MSAGKVVLALDGMGGDHAPDVVVNGADIARERYPGTTFLLFGDPARLKPLVDARKGLAAAVEIVAAEDAVLNEDKPTFVFVHGGYDHARSWDRIIEAFRDDYHVVAMDLRGHGDSDRAVGSQYAIPDLAIDVVRLVEEVGAPAVAQATAISLARQATAPD